MLGLFSGVVKAEGQRARPRELRVILWPWRSECSWVPGWMAFEPTPQMGIGAHRFWNGQGPKRGSFGNFAFGLAVPAAFAGNHEIASSGTTKKKRYAFSFAGEISDATLRLWKLVGDMPLPCARQSKHLRNQAAPASGGLASCPNPPDQSIQRGVVNLFLTFLNHNALRILRLGG